jgi:hypothetical protein
MISSISNKINIDLILVGEVLLDNAEGMVNGEYANSLRSLAGMVRESRSYIDILSIVW